MINHTLSKVYLNVVMKIISKQFLIYLTISLPGIVSLVMPYEVAILSYDAFSLGIITLITFIFIYLVTREILNRILPSLKTFVKSISIFFVVNGALFLLSAVIHRMNVSLGILSLAYGLAVFFASRSEIRSGDRIGEV